MFNSSVPPPQKKRYVSKTNVSLLAALKRAIVNTGKRQETRTHCKQTAGFMNIKAQVRVYMYYDSERLLFRFF